MQQREGREKCTGWDTRSGSSSRTTSLLHPSPPQILENPFSFSCGFDQGFMSLILWFVWWMVVSCLCRISEGTYDVTALATAFFCELPRLTPCNRFKALHNPFLFTPCTQSRICCRCFWKTNVEGHEESCCRS